MITIDAGKCIRCRLCMQTCHESCITLTEQGIVIDSGECSTCGQCIAVCPAQALGWDGHLSSPVQRHLFPAAEQMEAFLKSRRTIRHFSPEPIDRALLEKIAVIGKYSPTNNYAMEVIIVDRPEMKESLEVLCQNRLKLVYSIFFKHRILMRFFSLLTTQMQPRDKVKLEASIRSRSTLSSAPALILLVADERISHTEASAQYFLYNMSLYASTLGIGSCIIGGGKMLLNMSRKKTAALLQLPKHKSIVGILSLGYPAVTYSNCVEGIRPEISWR